MHVPETHSHIEDRTTVTFTKQYKTGKSGYLVFVLVPFTEIS